MMLTFWRKERCSINVKKIQKQYSLNYGNFYNYTVRVAILVATVTAMWMRTWKLDIYTYPSLLNGI
jgi:hypothetical protein